MVKDLPPDSPLTPGNGDQRYQQYGTVYERFMNAAEKAGIPAGFTPHSLRHAFASAMLSKGVPITDVAHWLGPAPPACLIVTASGRCIVHEWPDCLQTHARRARALMRGVPSAPRADRTRYPSRPLGAALHR
jgi:hypothetical protein